MEGGVNLEPEVGSFADFMPFIPEATADVLEGDRGAERTKTERLEELAKARDTREIRRLFFAGIATSLLLLIALALRDFIAGVVDDLFPRGGIKNRVIVLLVVAGVAIFIVLIIYEAELDR
jgi:hypothetical protein